MKIILALMMINCEYHIDLDACVDKGMECVEYNMSIKEIDDPKILISNDEEKLAKAFKICSDTVVIGNCDIPYGVQDN